MSSPTIHTPSFLSLLSASGIDPTSATVHLNLATLLAVLGEMPAAAEHCAEAARLEPGNTRAHFLLGLARLSLGDRAGAQAQVDRLQQLDPAAAAELSRQLAAAAGNPG